MKLKLILCMLLWSVCICAQESLPCIGTATTRLNVRSGPGKQYGRMDLLTPGKQVVVLKRANREWVLVKYDNQNGYVHSDYLKFSPLPQQKTVEKNKSGGVSSWFWDALKIIITIVLIYGSILIFFKVWVKALLISIRLVKLISMAFYISNWLQRFLQKPWYPFFKENRFSDSTNKRLRIATTILKTPLYILCTPLRFANAVFYNLLIHCAFEMLNYTSEVVDPSSDNEGENSPRALHLLLWRIIKYPIWHGSLVIVESMAWTVIDTFLPALTLYHGTDATGNIVSSPNRHGVNISNVGVWLVGGGNYAGNGIYFASALDTAEHYSCHHTIIVCRVTLGRIIDLGMAPRYVYNQCGYPNATGATRWGLNNGYVTGEWWRPDRSWWEFCMYDWQNRYNESWRIRPLYIISAYERDIVRINGGMHHWLFRSMVIKDIFTSICQPITSLFR